MMKLAYIGSQLLWFLWSSNAFLVPSTLSSSFSAKYMSEHEETQEISDSEMKQNMALAFFCLQKCFQQEANTFASPL